MPLRYSQAQTLSGCLRAEGTRGIAYDGVRHPGAECVAPFGSGSVGQVHRGERLSYEWSAPRGRIITVSRVVQECP